MEDCIPHSIGKVFLLHLNILSVTVVQQELETRAKFLHSHRDIHPQFITRHYGNQESNTYQDPDSNSNGPPWS